MRLKLYRGARMADAMAAVRAELGAEAFILSSRRVSGGFEVTAAAPRMAPDGVADVPADARVQRERALRFHGVPQSLWASLPDGDLAVGLGGLLKFSNAALSGVTRPILFVGPPGAGKTLTVARLAARFVLSGVRPAVMSLDGLKAGATAQLAALLDVLGVELSLGLPADLGAMLSRPRAAGPMLIDLAGSNPFDPADRQLLAGLFGQNHCHGAVVLPAGLAPEEAHDLACAYRALNAEFLVVTRLDVTRRLGSVVAAGRSGLILTDAGVSTAVIDGLVAMTPELLAARLLHVPAEWNANENV